MGGLDENRIDPDSPAAHRAAGIALAVVTAKVDLAAAPREMGWQSWADALRWAFEEVQQDPAMTFLVLGCLATFASYAVEMASELTGTAPATVMEVLAVQFEKMGLGF